MMQQIKMAEAIGKTLKATVLSDRAEEYLFVFSGGTFAALGIDYRSYYSIDYVREVKLDLLDFDDVALIGTGIATKQELDDLRDRETYERLKAKFEPMETEK